MAQKVIDVSSKEDKLFNQVLNDKLRKVHQTELNEELTNLKTKLSELEITSKILESKLQEITDITTVGPDNRLIELEMKFRQLETEKSELEYHMNLLKKQQAENIDKMVDSIRKISTQNADLDVSVRTLKTKVPHLEDITRRQESNIETIRQKFNDTTFDKIKELEKSVASLEDNNRKLEDQIEKMSVKQSKMSEEAEQKMKQTFEQKLELESKITKLKGKIKDLERINNDLHQRLEEMKTRAVEAAEQDKEKGMKLAAELEAINDHLGNVKGQNATLEKENQQLRKEMKILKVKLTAYEKNL